MARWRKDSTWTKELRYQTIHQSLLVQCDFFGILQHYCWWKTSVEINPGDFKNPEDFNAVFFQSLQMDGRNFPVSNLQVSRVPPRCTWYPMPGPHQLWKSSPWQPWNHCSQEVPRAKGGHLCRCRCKREGWVVIKRHLQKKRYRHIWCIIYLYLYIYICIYSYIYLYIYIYRLCNLSTCKRDWIVFDVIYFVHQERDETFLTKPRGTWKGVVVLIVATHRSTQGFRQFDGSLLSCGNIRTWWKRSVAPLSSGKMLFRHVGMIYGMHYTYIYIYIHQYICGYVLFGSERSDKLIVFSKTLLLQRGSHQRRSAKQGTWPTWIDSKTNKSQFPSN